MGKAAEADRTSYTIPCLCFPLPYVQMWDNPFISWNPEECVNINKLTISAENLWIPDIVIIESYVSELGKTCMKPLCKEQPRASAGHRDTKRLRQGHSLT